ncbi:PilX N-terminal domain-containing pilus assembly protein [Salinisphaera sp. SPP-AMP-43]|uniref:pilus assembly PilX family protein n=1 Tax=Salinisphaera sp. SPP-AMP-43 TaxID=3121288 RepID=UPI003C6E0D91
MSGYCQHRRCGHAHRNGQTGFILVTSLVFLVLLTLLAVSAINSSTLQQRMASNQREKSKALNAADSALVHVERILATDDFVRCNAAFAGAPNDANPDSPCHSYQSQVDVAVAGVKPSASPDYFMSDAFWNRPEIGHYTNDAELNVDYMVENLSGQASHDLDAGKLADTQLFRITARARGRAPAARAVVQSVYQVSR